MSGWRFNPCCAGCGFQTGHHRQSTGPVPLVSILVVLDVGFRRDCGCHDWIQQDVSILVVLDVGFRLPSVTDWTVDGHVSILVVLDAGFRPWSGYPQYNNVR